MTRRIRGHLPRIAATTCVAGLALAGAAAPRAAATPWEVVGGPSLAPAQRGVFGSSLLFAGRRFLATQEHGARRQGAPTLYQVVVWTFDAMRRAWFPIDHPPNRIDRTAVNPRLAVVGERLFAVWQEHDDEVYRLHFAWRDPLAGRGHWTEIDPPPGQGDGIREEPDVLVVNDVLHVGWRATRRGQTRIRVARLRGDAWEFLDMDVGAGDADYASQPRLTAARAAPGEPPRLAVFWFADQRLHAIGEVDGVLRQLRPPKRTPPADAYAPISTTTSLGNAPDVTWLAFAAPDGEIRVLSHIPDSVTVGRFPSPSENAEWRGRDPNIAWIDGQLYLAFVDARDEPQIVVLRYDPGTLEWRPAADPITRLDGRDVRMARPRIERDHTREWGGLAVTFDVQRADDDPGAEPAWSVRTVSRPFDG